MRAIFISYRRSDSEGESGRLFDDLISRFSDRSVFMDVAAIEPGRDFRKAIEESIHACSVLLAVIGQQWLELDRRSRDAGDSTTKATICGWRSRSALHVATYPSSPFWVRGARMPRADQLPADLEDLAHRNAVELTHAPLEVQTSNSSSRP